MTSHCHILFFCSVFAALLTISAGCSSRKVEQELIITPCAPLPVARTSATCFAYRGKCYVFGGRNDTTNFRKGFLGDCWAYDTMSDKWTRMPDMPFKPRTKAAAVVVDDYVYCGLGFNGVINTDSCYLKDWWRWHIPTDTWTRLADFPTTDTNMPVTAYYNKKIYSIFPTHSGSSRLVYEYDIQSDKWSQWPDDWHIETIGGATGAQIDSICYAGGGYFLGMKSQWYAFNLASATYIRKHDMPGGGRMFASAALLNNRIYVFGGRKTAEYAKSETLLNDILLYDYTADRWHYCGTLPFSGRDQMVSAVASDNIYFGTGEDRDLIPQNDWYCLKCAD